MSYNRIKAHFVAYHDGNRSGSGKRFSSARERAASFSSFFYADCDRGLERCRKGESVGSVSDPATTKIKRRSNEEAEHGSSIVRRARAKRQQGYRRQTGGR